ncbi:hypothetical protein CMT52_11265 [Elizabethkingia anophelis]|nr:hypothetical protein [Elizabethkingia anophelis]
MNTKKQRLDYFRKTKGLKYSDLIGDESIVSTDNLRVTVSRENEKVDYYLRLIAKKHNISEQWLISGIGEMEQELTNSISKSEVVPVPYENYMVVEYADLSTAAGKLGVDNPAVLPEMKKRLVPKEFDNGNYLVVKVDGDSMDNGTNISIPDGTEILIKEYFLNNGDKLPIRNNLFVIVTQTGTVFKQITEHNTEQGYINCHSYNPKYNDYRIQMDEVIQIFVYRKIVSFRPSIPEVIN